MSNKVRRIYLDEKAGIFDYDLDGEHVLMLWSDYERLRAEVAEKSEALEIFQGKLTEACGMLADNAKTIGQLRAAAWKIADEREEAEGKFCRRIEELEQQLSYAHRCPFCAIDGDETVIIPNERIDKAWAKIQTRAEPVYHQGMERALEIIGIVDDGEGGWRMSDE